VVGGGGKSELTTLCEEQPDLFGLATFTSVMVECDVWLWHGAAVEVERGGGQWGGRGQVCQPLGGVVHERERENANVGAECVRATRIRPLLAHCSFPLGMLYRTPHVGVGQFPHQTMQRNGPHLGVEAYIYFVGGANLWKQLCSNIAY
jgi:hypothetical protein